MSARSLQRRLAAPPAKIALRTLLAARRRGLPSTARLYVVGDGGSWSVDEDAVHLAACARRLGYAVGRSRLAHLDRRQTVFLTSHFDALSRRWLRTSHRLGTAYLHGRPGTPGMPEFDEAYEALRREPRRLERIQVTHAEMHDLVLGAGVPSERVFRIPIGIDLEHFALGDDGARARSRRALGLPEAAFVAGSFQKDGVGWGEGLEPKLIKGPDVLVAALARLREWAPELVVLLTGPARGWVRRELERLSIPYRHVLARSRRELAAAYHALDVYLVAARQEGGPKAVLEAMATGVPLATTRVGQVPDLVEGGRNGLVVEPEDAEGLARAAAGVRDDPSLVAALRAGGRETAERYRYERLDELWAPLLEGFAPPLRRT
jgi:glycosyltransferase involved in cell wall biosynthesis